MVIAKKNLGSGFNDFLAEEGILEEVQAEAVKRVLAWQIEQHLTENKIQKAEFAKQIKTSRSQLDRLLDSKNTSLNLKTLAKVGEAMGKRVEVRFS